MPYEVGERVRIVGPLDINWGPYVGSLEQYVGKVGVIEQVYIGRYLVRFEDDSWWFQSNNVVGANFSLSEREFIFQQIATLQQRLKEI